MTLVSFKAISGSDLLFLINVKSAILGNMTLATILLWREGERLLVTTAVLEVSTDSKTRSGDQE